MEVTKAPPPDIGTARPEAPAPKQQTEPSLRAAPSPTGDRVDIQPLSVSSALQILIAEVRAELHLPVLTPPAQSAAQAAQIVVDLLLQALPGEAGAPGVVTPTVDTPGAAPPAAVDAEFAALARIDAALSTALDRAVATVMAWRNVPQAAVDAARDARALIATLLHDDPPTALWGRPEWAWLAPHVQRYWRRRRGRRDPRHPGLSDPDYAHPQEAGDERREPPSG